MTTTKTAPAPTSAPSAPLVSTRPKDRDPAFPARVIRFSKANETAYELVLFQPSETVATEYRSYLAMAVGAIRVIKSVKDLADVPTPVLLDIFNKTRGEKP